ncbi:MAG: hypothetical protein Q8M03_06180 [Legionella sp.]|nr:hypothetical protein [Legionella sp.]
MEFIDITNFIIPGYDSLSEEEKKAFEESLPGQQFNQLINDILASLKELQETESYWGSILRYWNLITGHSEKEKKGLRNQFEQQKSKLLTDIKDSKEYQSIIDSITINLLKNTFPDVELLQKSQQEIIARTEFSQALLTKINALDKDIKQINNQQSNDEWAQINSAGLIQIKSLEKLKKQKQKAVREWKEAFSQNPEMEQFGLEIATIKRNARTNKLSTFFPLLNYRLSPDLVTPMNILRVTHALNSGDINFDPELIEKSTLSDFFFHLMQQVSQTEINFIELDAFNHKQADKMAQSILNDFNNNRQWDMDEWFNEYSYKLYKHLHKEMHLINNHPWETPPVSQGQQWLSALSFLWNNKAVDEGNKFVSKLADAHAFIQATSFSTQNESSFLAILDFYNYGRYCEQISETKSIFVNLLSVFRPLYDEYKEIAFYEKNIYWKAFRTLMPLIIVAAFIVLVGALLAPLAIPDLAFLVAFIPALIVGLALATQYVKIKDGLYKYFREIFYGGRYEIPEFQCNERMNSALTPTNAAEARKFYISELTLCDETESRYQPKAKKGLLTQDEIAAREKNTLRRHQLCLEWYDIHSNNELAFEQIPQIVLARVQQTGDMKYFELQNTFLEERTAIEEAVNTVTTHLQDTIKKYNIAPREPSIEATLIKTNYKDGLFSSPRGFIHKASLEKIATLKEQISAPDIEQLPLN